MTRRQSSRSAASRAKKLQQNEHGLPERAGHARWGVLGRPDSAAIEAPCVLPAHAPIAPRQRVVIQLELLSRRRANEETGRGFLRDRPLAAVEADRELIGGRR